MQSRENRRFGEFHVKYEEDKKKMAPTLQAY